MRKLDIVEFILRSNRIHNNFYDYSISKYDTKEKIEIICPKHGIFHQRASSHMSGSGCKKCYDEKRHFQSKTLDINFFLENSIKKHGDKYDYSESEYINSYTKIKIICREHGPFYQIPSSHFTFDDPCPQCRKLSKDKIIERFNKKHNNKYDYSLFDYQPDTTTKHYIDIICPIHGKFNQRINHHMCGAGCPMCRESLGEKLINEILIEIGLIPNKDFYRQQGFDGLINENSLFFDFYIPGHRLCIEFDGVQHIMPIKIFGGEKTFTKIKKRDKIKNEYCIKNNIRLLRFNQKDKKDSILERIVDSFK